MNELPADAHPKKITRDSKVQKKSGAKRENVSDVASGRNATAKNTLPQKNPTAQPFIREFKAHQIKPYKII